MDISQLNGGQKAALLMLAWGEDVATDVCKNLKEGEVQDLTMNMSSMESMSADDVNKVANEYYDMAMKGMMTRGDIELIRKILVQSMGEEKAADLIETLFFAAEETRLMILNTLDPKTLLNFLKNEHPQTVAVILANMNPVKASDVLGGLPPEQQSDIIKRIAKLETISSDMVKEIEQALKDEFKSTALASAKVGGVQTCANVLNQVERTMEEDILAKIEEDDPELAEAIRHQMFTFEDLIFVDDRGLQDVLKEVNREDLVRGLKTATDELKEKVYKNMSRRAVEMVQEELEMLGPVRLTDVERAQREIIQTARRLQDEGKIVISKGGGEALV